jgi:hypothetical protein
VSKLVDTELGQFREVIDGFNKRFLFECPDCHEMLPMDEEIMAGRKSIDHESRVHGGCLCTFSGTREFGRVLISTMQAKILMGYKPCHDEGEDCWQPSRGGGCDGII